MSIITNILAHPLTRGLDIDDPGTTSLRQQIILNKKFLHQIYEGWYTSLIAAIPGGNGNVLELGSGAGFVAEFLPEIITSEVFPCPHIRLIASAHQLPFANQSLRGIVMTDVLHHIPKPRAFFSEAARCIRPAGVIAMVEPWVTPWSSLIYRHLHHELFDPRAATWELTENGPLSSGNGAMPWIIFHRDRQKFLSEFPEWVIKVIEPSMPLRYLLSGGVSMRSLMPGWTFNFWKAIERPLHEHAGMFARIVLVRK